MLNLSKLNNVRLKEILKKWMDSVIKEKESKFKKNSFLFIKFRDTDDLKKKIKYAEEGISMNKKDPMLFPDLDIINKSEGIDLLKFEIDVFEEFLFLIKEYNELYKNEEDIECLNLDKIKELVQKSIIFINKNKEKYCNKRVVNDDDEYNEGEVRELEWALEVEAIYEDAERWGRTIPYNYYGKRLHPARIKELHDKYYR